MTIALSANIKDSASGLVFVSSPSMRVPVFVLLAFSVVVYGGRWCPPGSFDIPQSNECLHTETAPNSFFIANGFCSYMGGNLIKITNAFLNSIVAGQALSVLSGSQAFIGVVKSGNNNWTYVDGSPLTYTNWMQGQPSQGNGSCAVVDPLSVQWMTADCNASLPYFCTISDLSTPCPNGWTYYYDTDTCYYIHQTSDPAVSYYSDDAEKYCVSMGGHLASIHSQKENSFFMRIIATNNADKNHCDLGEVNFGLRCAPGGYSWTDGSPVDYTFNGTKCTGNPWVYGAINDPNCASEQYLRWDEWQTSKVFSRFACKIPAH